MDIKEYIRSQSFKGVLTGVAITLVVLCVFQAGVFVGYRKASFTYHSGDNYYRTFGERHDTFNMPVRTGFVAAHGAVGKIVSITLPTFMVEGPDNVEKVVLIGTSTLIRRFDEQLQPTDLKADDFVVVLGEPNEEAQIEAKLIRIMPAPPTR